MRRQIKKITGIIAALFVIAGLSTGISVYAASNETGAAGALTETEYTLEEMLTYAIEDEYMAQAEYTAIIEAFAVQRPFTNLLRAEGVHISLLTPLLETYQVAVPQKDWKALAAVPESLDAAYLVGIAAEEKNIAMYESFLTQELPADVQEVFERLLAASNRHLIALQKLGVCDNTGTGYGTGNNGAGSCTGTGTCTQDDGQRNSRTGMGRGGNGNRR